MFTPGKELKRSGNLFDSLHPSKGKQKTRKENPPMSFKRGSFGPEKEGLG